MLTLNIMAWNLLCTAVLREAWVTLPESSSRPLLATLAQTHNLAHASLETAVYVSGLPLWQMPLRKLCLHGHTVIFRTAMKFNPVIALVQCMTSLHGCLLKGGLD